jgi:ParB family chromosome partitioning protein
MKATNKLLDIPIIKIRTGRNPRKTFHEESLRELADSIREHGLTEPIVVEPDGKGYILVAGERRLRATKLAGLVTIPSIVRASSNHNGRERFVLSIVENEQREDMNQMDRAEAYQSLRDEFGMSVSKIAQKVGRNVQVIYNFLLLTKLDDQIKELLRAGWLKDARLANALLTIPDADTRVNLAKRLYANKVSLKGCLAACARTSEMLMVAPRRAGRPSMKGTPALALAAEQSRVDADETHAPPRWNLLKQMGKAPEWSMVAASANETCVACPLKDIASPINCKDCGAVYLLQRLMEMAK